MGQISKKGKSILFGYRSVHFVHSVFQNNLKIVTIQWSLLVAGLAMMLIGLGLVAFRNGTFKIKRNFTSMRPGKL